MTFQLIDDALDAVPDREDELAAEDFAAETPTDGTWPEAGAMSTSDGLGA